MNTNDIRLNVESCALQPNDLLNIIMLITLKKMVAAHFEGINVDSVSGL